MEEQQSPSTEKPSTEKPSMEKKQSLNYSQVSKLNTVLSTELEIHSHNNFPSLLLTPAGLVKTVKSNLTKKGINVEDIRMNGSAASFCICEDSSHHPKIHYNDIDLIFGVSITEDSDFHIIKDVVMTSLLDYLPEVVSKSNITSQLMEETYARKMVLVSNQNARWSLVSLGDSGSASTTIELKFVDKIRRKYEFTVDSFQILIDSYFAYNECAEESPVSMSQRFFPSVHAISVYHDYEEALDHLNNRLIHTDAPEEIRGGGLLKYCSLLANRFKPADSEKMAHLEPYMCSRFFIDFPTEEVQYQKVVKYVTSRFVQRGEGAHRGVEFLDILYAVVSSRAKCLAESERRRTMGVILYIRSMLLPIPPVADFFPPLPCHHIITGFHAAAVSHHPSAYYQQQHDYNSIASTSNSRTSPPPPPTTTITTTTMNHHHHQYYHHHQQQQPVSTRWHHHHHPRRNNNPSYSRLTWKPVGTARPTGAVR